MKPQSAIAKGKLLEDFIAKKLREGGIDQHARRTHGSGNGLEKGDIYNSLGMSIECKNQKRFQFEKFWRQTVRDSEKTHTAPVLIWHIPDTSLEECAVILRLSDWIELMQKQNETIIVESNFDKTLKWKVKRLKDAANDVFKELHNEL